MNAIDEEWTGEKVKCPILVSNYDETHAEVIKQLFERFGFEQVYSAWKPDEIIEIVMKVRPRIVIRDFNYPGMGGDVLTQKIKGVPGMEHVRQILFPPRGFGWEDSDEVLIESPSLDYKVLAEYVREELKQFEQE